MQCKIKMTKNIKKSLDKQISSHNKDLLKLKNKETTISNKKQLNKSKNKLIKKWKSAHFHLGSKLQIQHSGMTKKLDQDRVLIFRRRKINFKPKKSWASNKKDVIKPLK